MYRPQVRSLAIPGLQSAETLERLDDPETDDRRVPRKLLWLGEAGPRPAPMGCKRLKKNYTWTEFWVASSAACQGPPCAISTDSPGRSLE
jgi:hypothetical protein